MGLRLIRSFSAGHGDANGLIWGPEGRYVYLANGEGYGKAGSATKIDALNPAAPLIAAQNGEHIFQWRASVAGDVLVLRASTDGSLVRYATTDMTPLWVRSPGEGHSLAVGPGGHIYVPVAGAPGLLAVYDQNGTLLNSVIAAEAWVGTYSTVLEGNTLVVSHSTGCRLFDLTNPALPVARGSLPGFGDVAIRAGRLWRQAVVSPGLPPAGVRRLECWSVANMDAPTLLGSWPVPTTPDPGDPSIVYWLTIHVPVVNADATRLYVGFGHDIGSSQQTSYQHMLPGGVLTFDVSGNAPALLHQVNWPSHPHGAFDFIGPLFVALHPTQPLLAAAINTFGVFFFDVSAAPRLVGEIITAGETNDSATDGTYLYDFARGNVQVFDLTTGQEFSHEHFQLRGAWKPFKDGTLLLPANINTRPLGGAQAVVRLVSGRVQAVGSLEGPGAPTAHDNVLDGDLIYSATDGDFVVGRVGLFDPNRSYPYTDIAHVAPPIAPGAERQDAAILTGVVKAGGLVWLVGENVGVVAYDVSNPAAPTLAFRDAFFFARHGQPNIITLGGFMYAACGSKRVRIYRVSPPGFVGEIPDWITANFVDAIAVPNQGDFLLATHYWIMDPAQEQSEGLYVYRVDASGIAMRWEKWPVDSSVSAFFSRFVPGTPTRVLFSALAGIDLLEMEFVFVMD